MLGSQFRPLGHPEYLIGATSRLLAGVEGALAGDVGAVLDGKDSWREAFLDRRPLALQAFRQALEGKEHFFVQLAVGVGNVDVAERGLH